MASQLDPVTPLTVHIRSPTLADSISVTTSLDATIIALKRTLQDVHPARPDPADQRLIYQGKLLADTDVLNKVLKKSDLSTEPIFHLVVKPSSMSTSTSHAYPSDFTNQLRQRNAFSSTPAQYQQQVFTPGNVYQAQAAFAPWPAMQQTLSQPAQLQMQQVVPGYQYVVINGQPYLAPISYPQPSVYSYPYPTATPTQPLAHAPNTDPAVAAYHQYYHDLVVRYAQQQQQQLAAAAAAPQNALAAPVVPAVADNNNPVALAERHARRRSALSLAIKLIFMLFVLGRGASFERVVVLHIIAIVIFFYRTGRLRFVVRRANLGGAREENAQAPPAPQPGAVPQPPLQPAATPAPQNPNGGAGSAEQQPTGPADPVQPPPPAPVSPLRQIEHALYTFVTSLIPSVPDQAVEQQDMGGF